MTIDRMIEELEELRRLYGGDTIVRRVVKKNDETFLRELDFEIYNLPVGGLRIVRVNLL
jgi:hypothetical protein